MLAQIEASVLTSLPAGEVTSISLPIYFHPQSAETGAYERNIAVKVWGSDSTVLNEKRPLHIVVPNRQALYVSGLAVLASCVGLVVMLRFHRQFFVRFTTKQLIVIALFWDNSLCYGCCAINTVPKPHPSSVRSLICTGDRIGY